MNLSSFPLFCQSICPRYTIMTVTLIIKAKIVGWQKACSVYLRSQMVNNISSWAFICIDIKGMFFEHIDILYSLCGDTSNQIKPLTNCSSSDSVHEYTLLGKRVEPMTSLHGNLLNIFINDMFYAARQLNAIKCLQCNLDKESRLGIYRSYILSNFNYCPLVWHFWEIRNSRNMEK